MAMLVKSGVECNSGDVPPGSFDSVKGHDRAEAVGQDVLADAAPRRGYDGRARARGCQL